MKNVVEYYLFAIVSFICLFVSTSNAQERWYLRSGTITLPFMENQFLYTGSGPYTNDSGTDGSIVYSFPIMPTSSGNNTISKDSSVVLLSWHNNSRYRLGLQKISFLIDTGQKILKDFLFSFFLDTTEINGGYHYSIIENDNLFFFIS